MALTIGKKLGMSTVLFSLAAVVPFAVLSLMAVSTARDSFIEDRFAQLNSIRGIKKAQVENFFAEREHDMSMLVENVRNLREGAFQKLKVVQDIKKSQIEGFFRERMADISVLSTSETAASALEAFSQAFNRETRLMVEENRKTAENAYGPWLEQYKKEHGYHDCYLIDKGGDVIYTAAKESDLGQNLLTGELKNSPLAKCFQKALKDVAIQDFEPYAPSGNRHAAFIGAPVKRGPQTLGVVALQFPTSPINAIVQRREGMGKTGETYLVAEKGERVSFRSDMKTMGDGKYIIGHDITDIKTRYIDDALAGKAGHDVFTDSSGTLVMVAYGPLDIQGLKWASISKIDLEESIAPGLEGDKKDFYAQYIDYYGYYDLFLIHPEGKVFYSVTHEPDYGTNMVNGEYKDSGLGKLVRRVLETKKFGLADFEPYAPSKNEPAAFIAKPMLHGDEVELIVALQLSIDAINHIMQERTGMGKTGETYLVGQDKLMRSDSYLDPTNHSVKASFASPEKGKVDTEASREALAGKQGHKLLVDYNGHMVLSAYAPVRVGDTRWALLAEIDEKEVISESVAAENLLNKVWLIGMISGAAIFLVILFNIFNARKLVKVLRNLIDGLSNGAEQVASASGQISSASQHLAEGASEQAASLEETSSSLEEMSAMTTQNADHATEADLLMKESEQVVGQANSSMSELTMSMKEISKASEDTQKIVRTIDEIAFQTNLLALNAAVEAARAGEAGSGFAVVADEVRNLAMRAGDAAKQTANLIEGTVKKILDGSQLVAMTNEAFSGVTESTSKVGVLVSEIATASKEQAEGITQVNKAVAEMDLVVQQNAADAEENASASEELNAQTEQMKEFVGELVAMVGGR